jgi:hypothetical protein
MGASRLDWYETVLFVIDMRSFSSLWYWIGVAVVWSSVSHWVLGVPNDLIFRARRNGGQPEADVQALVRINVDRLLWIERVSGVWILGISFFILSALATLGFYYRVEFAQAVFLLMAPLAAVGALSLRTARRIAAEGMGVPELYRRLSLHRTMVQGIGVVAIFVTSMWGMWHNMQANVLGY